MENILQRFIRVESPCLEIFKRRADTALGDMIQWWTLRYSSTDFLKNTSGAGSSVCKLQHLLGGNLRQKVVNCQPFP